MSPITIRGQDVRAIRVALEHIEQHLAVLAAAAQRDASGPMAQQILDLMHELTGTKESVRLDAPAAFLHGPAGTGMGGATILPLARAEWECPACQDKTSGATVPVYLGELPAGAKCHCPSCGADWEAPAA